MVERRRKSAGGMPHAPGPASATGSVAQPVVAPVHEGRVRAVVDALLPSVDGGRFAPKRIAGEPVFVEAHCFADGHDRLRAVLSWQLVGDPESFEVEMTARVNDVWTAEFTPPAPGRYQYTLTAWVDHFDSWRHDLTRRDDHNDIRVALQVGAGLVEAASRRARADDAASLSTWAALLRDTADDTQGHRGGRE